MSVDLSRVPAPVLQLCAQLRSCKKRAWVVGGCVRDLALGRPVNDWDICTDAKPDELMKIFPRAIPTGLQHGTVTVVLGGEHYEITTLRGEGTYSDGRRPDSVHFVSDIEDDLLRRDFTINAMAIDSETGVWMDPYGGQKDLQAGIIRAVGVAFERFSEDGLRVLRAARFAAQLGFLVEPDTLTAIAATIGTFKKVSQERVRDEWLKTMRSKQPSLAFNIMRDTGILQVSCPELMEGVGCEQNKYHTYDVWGHAMACMDACVGDPILRIGALLHDVGKPRSRAFSDKTKDYTFYEHERIGAEMVQPLCDRLKFSTDEKARITDVVRHHMWHYDDWSDAAVRRWLKRVGLHRLDDLYALREADLQGKGPEKIGPDDLQSLTQLKAHVERVLAQGAALSIRDLKINGHDLMQSLAVKPGKILGDTLSHLLDEVISNPEVNEREALFELAKKFVAERLAPTS
jgi:tRNA nucleotidyltransferase (CCA-adding enzyme)